MTTITCKRADLAHALALGVRALPTNPRHVAEGLLTLHAAGEQLRVVAASYDTLIETPLAGVCTVAAAEVVMPGRLVADWVKAARGDRVTITLTGDEIRLEAGRTLALTAPKVDPVTATTSDVDGVTVSEVSRDLLADALKRVSGAVGRDELLPTFTGVHMTASDGILTLQATDRYIIAQVAIEGVATEEGDFEALPVHRQLSGIVSQLGPMLALTRAGGVLWILDDLGAKVRLTLLDGDFPKIGYVLDLPRPMATDVDAKALRAEVADAARLVTSTGTKTPSITLTTTTTGMLEVSISADSHGVHGSGLPVDADGDVVEVVLNPHYLLAALDAVGPVERVRLLHFGGGVNKPPRLDSADSTGVGVLMPIRAN